MPQQHDLLPQPTKRKGPLAPVNRPVAPSRRALPYLTVVILLLMAAVIVTFQTVPLRNFSGEPVDALLVLGSPATSSGAMTPMQYWRVSEAVNEYKRGRAPYILFSGGAAANQFTESVIMKQGAIHMGVPAQAILTEERSRTTLENVNDSLTILQGQHWRRVEVISSPEHLPRTAVLLGHTDLLWTLHPCSTAFRPWWKGAIAYTTEAVATTLVRWFGLRITPAIHAVSKWSNLQVLRIRVRWARLSHQDFPTQP